MKLTVDEFERFCKDNNLAKYELYNILFIARRSMERVLKGERSLSASLSERFFYITGDKRYQTGADDEDVALSRYLVTLWKRGGIKSIPKEFMRIHAGREKENRDVVAAAILAAMEKDKDLNLFDHEQLFEKLIKYLTAEFEKGSVPHLSNPSMVVRLTNLLVCLQKENPLLYYQTIKNFNLK